MVTGWRNQARRALEQEANVLIDRLVAGEITIQFWEREMQALLRNAHISDYLLARGGTNSLTAADRAAIGAELSMQYRHLRTFARELIEAETSDRAAKARARMYARSGNTSFNLGRGAAWGVNLPGHPGQGTECLSNCFVGDTEIEAVGIKAGYRRWYEGPMVTLETEAGRIITVTPNHPIATDRGWIAAGLLHEGDNLIAASIRERYVLGEPHIEHDPVTIKQVVDTLQDTGLSVGVPGLVQDFHGDGRTGDVDVVLANGELWDRVQSGTLQSRPQLQLAQSDTLTIPSSFRYSTPIESFNRVAVSTPSIMGRCTECGSLIGTEFSHSGEHGITSPPDWDAFLNQPPSDDASIDREGPGQGDFGFPIVVSTDKIIDIKQDIAARHVYNLSTEGEWYIANGIVSHNCRCVWIITRRGNQTIASWRTASGDSCATCLDRGRRWAELIFD